MRLVSRDRLLLSAASGSKKGKEKEKLKEYKGSEMVRLISSPPSLLRTQWEWQHNILSHKQ